MRLDDFIKGAGNHLNEAMLTIPSHSGIEEKRVRVYKNVGGNSLLGIIEMSRAEAVRALMQGDDIYYWDSYYATHAEVAKGLGVLYDIRQRLIIWEAQQEESSINPCIMVANEFGYDIMHANKGLRFLMENPRVWISSEVGKFVWGPKLLSLLTTD